METFLEVTTPCWAGGTLDGTRQVRLSLISDCCLRSAMTPSSVLTHLQITEQTEAHMLRGLRTSRRCPSVRWTGPQAQSIALQPAAHRPLVAGCRLSRMLPAHVRIRKSATFWAPPESKLSVSPNSASHFVPILFYHPRNIC
jgi:hypothetical protein